MKLDTPRTVADLVAVCCAQCGEPFARRYSAVRPDACPKCAPLDPFRDPAADARTLAP